MAAGTLPKPGTQYGPCETPCEHADCVDTRAMAASLCHWCQQSIGYDTRFYKTQAFFAGTPPVDATRLGLAHAVCEEAALEAGKSVPLVKRVAVKSSRPSMRGGWQCLLICGCDVHEPTAKRRPKAVDHVCPPSREE